MAPPVPAGQEEAGRREQQWRELAMGAHPATRASSRAAKRGFWTGLITGILLCGALALAIAIAFPPFVFEPPRVPAEADTPPGGPQVPGIAGAEAAAPEPAATVAAPTAPGPLIASGREPGPLPGLEDIVPTPAPDVFEGGAAGSPSLYQPSAN
jgi:hypothetical protein